MTAQADRNQSEAKKAEAGPKQRKLLKTTKPKRRKLLTTETETARAAENMNRNGANRWQQRTKTAQAAENESQAKHGHCNTTTVFYGVTRTRAQGNHEIKSRKANESKESVGYTKLDAVVQPRLCKSQGTEVIRKSGLPFSLLAPPNPPRKGGLKKKLKSLPFRGRFSGGFSLI